MSQVKTIFKNMSWLFVSQIIAAICGFVWTILIARYLSVSDYGIMNFAISFTGIIAITMDLGISTHIIRHIATDFDSAPKYLGNAIPLKSIFSFLTILLALIILIIMKCNEFTIQITLLFTIERIFSSMISLFNGSLQAIEEGKYQAIGNILLNSLLLIFILLSIIDNFGLYGITLAYVAANFFVVIFQYIVVKKRITKPKFELNIEFCKKITLYSIPFALTSFFGMIIYSADMVMLTSMVGSYENGIYSAAYKLISVLTLFFGVYTAVIFPVMSRFYKNEKNLLVISFEKSLKYIMLIIIPITFATMLYSNDIVVLFFGQKYSPTSTVLSILMWTVSLGFINGVCQNLLNASHKEKYVTLIFLVATLANIILNFLIIPKYSYNGAAMTTVLSEMILFSLYIYSIYKLDALPKKRVYFDLFKIITSSIILYFVLSFLNLNMWLALPVGIIIYFIIIISMKTFDEDDKFIFKEILGKN
ncbi:MAG: flippase [Methanobrevibacter sp.]|uniref:flippase n=1 Tax=Methanobrevibacter sp. TaxID=66852 RepID=UPI002E75D512|nr:flippase [Methanobrevibacter sp.]MEE0935222.1 flippase [Methanobrevibacter sp.]